MDVDGNVYCPGHPPREACLSTKGHSKTNSLANSQFSFPVTFNSLSMVFKSLSVWVEVLIEKEK